MIFLNLDQPLPNERKSESMLSLTTAKHYDSSFELLFVAVGWCQAYLPIAGEDGCRLADRKSASRSNRLRFEEQAQNDGLC